MASIQKRQVTSKDRAYIVANDVAATYRDIGFEVDVALKENDDCIVVTALDLAGNSKQVRISW